MDIHIEISQSLFRWRQRIWPMIYKNPSRFKKCFNIASTDEHIHFVLLLSLSRLFNHVLLCIIERLLSFKLIKMHKFLLFLICRHSQTFCHLNLFHLGKLILTYFKYLVNQQFCKRQYLPLHWTLSIITLQMLFMLKQQHYTLKLKKWNHNQGPL